jgi:hypothetical protein
MTHSRLAVGVALSVLAGAIAVKKGRHDEKAVISPTHHHRLGRIA